MNSNSAESAGAPSEAAAPHRIKLVLEYDGTDFHGWQSQGREDEGAVRTVQDELERALARIAGTPVRVAGAGRTDEGVHADGQVASFDWPKHLPVDKLPEALNALLPRDMSARMASVAAPDFHALASATGKRYVYSVWNARARSARHARTHWHVRYPMRLDLLREAAPALVGTHDFAAFATNTTEIQELRAAQGKPEMPTVKEIFDVRIDAPEPLDAEFLGEVRFTVEGSGFLYKMVRTIVGSLVDVGRGRHEPAWLAQALASKDRRQAGPTAPPQGLSLVRVFYENERA